MKKVLLLIFAGMLISNVASLYVRAKIVYWQETHSSFQGMPTTWDTNVAELIARPIDTLYEWNKVWHK